MEISRILITGAGGIVGRGIRPSLAGRFDELVLVDRSPIETIAPNERTIRGDIADPGVIREATDGIVGVVHLACAHGLEISFEDTVETNNRGLVRLMDGFIAAGGKSFVFASSHHGWGLYPRGTPISIDAPPKPDGWYGVSKVFGEATLAFYAHSHGFSGVSLRIGNVDGAVIDERRTHMWMSFRDLAEVTSLALQRREPGHLAIYTTANCPEPFFDNSGLGLLGFVPQDRPEDHLARSEIASEPPFNGIAGEAVGGAYAKANLRTDIETWRRSVSRDG